MLQLILVLAPQIVKLSWLDVDDVCYEVLIINHVFVITKPSV